MGLDVSIAVSIVTVLNTGDDAPPPSGGGSLDFSVASNSMYVPVLGF
jgi:hypothetical protein